MESITKLRKAPLVEAIFELRWRVKNNTQPPTIDPHYRILVGKIYEKIESEYPYHEQLPTAEMPDSISEFVVQHRFRIKENGWPLIQLGPGIITLNDTENYKWSDFANRIDNLLSLVFTVHPELKNIEFLGLLLRYIDAYPFDFDKNDTFNFLNKKLKVKIGLPESLFIDSGVSKNPLGVDFHFTYPSTQPKGAFHLRFVRGEKNKRPALIWETVVQSIKTDVPNTKKEMQEWAEKSHDLTHNWFFKLIEGELLEEFR
jgi:uncharacterized protein (TIGR04255 family)